MTADRPRSPEVAVLAVVDALPFKAAVLDATAAPVHINPLMREYHGIAADADVRTAPGMFVHPDDRSISREVIGGMISGAGSSGQAEVRIRRHDGEYRWHICLASPLPGTGAASSWIATFVDIEDHRRLEGELVHARAQADESLALLDTVQASAPIGFALVDADFVFQRINESLAEINGLPVAEHIGRPVREVVPTLWDQLEPSYQQALAGEAVHDVEIVGETPARPGERRAWLASYYPVRTGGEVAGVGVVAREVTEERRLAAQLNQAQKMQAVGQLAGGVAHDFNNVLATVMLSAELLRSEVDEPDQQVALDRILTAARSATELTRKLLYFARRQPTNPAFVNVAETVHRVLDLLAGTIGSTIEVDVNVDGCPPVTIDPTHFEQVLLNLVINARDAMPSGGRLSVSALRVPIGTRLDSPVVIEDSVALVVADTGEGMSDEVRERAVEPFFTTKGAGVGTGLGLSTVHGIVTDAGGRMSIYSEAGLGTSVQVELPVAKTGLAVADPVPEAPRRGMGQRVLVVEDQEGLRDSIAEILTAAGYLVTATDDGSEAARLLAGGLAVDLVLSDVVMPGTTGPDLAMSLTTTHPGTPVVLMSGYVGGVLAAHGVLADATVLSKPFTGDALLGAVSDALRRPATRRG
jgi:two-component system cell cycle sensor histidine kinase/response regulator CckA